jgi:hypothetical protein
MLVTGLDGNSLDLTIEKISTILYHIGIIIEYGKILPCQEAVCALGQSFSLAHHCRVLLSWGVLGRKPIISGRRRSGRAKPKTN